jgi:hypothetical protein
MGPRLLVVIVYLKQIVLPLFGTARTMIEGRKILDDMSSGTTPLLALSVGVLAIVVMTIAAVRNPNVRWLYLAGGVLLVLSYVGALGDHKMLVSGTFGDRYEFAPNACFGLVLLGLACTTPAWWRILPAFVVCCLVWTGANEYWTVREAYGDGPAWPQEVARWRADPSYRVQFWPTLNVWKWPMQPDPGLDGSAPKP